MSQPSENPTGLQRKSDPLKPFWGKVLRQLVASNAPLAPGAIGYKLGLSTNRRDQTVRAALQALERRGLAERGSWLRPAEVWRATSAGLALVRHSAGLHFDSAERDALVVIVENWISEGFASEPYSDEQYSIFEKLGIDNSGIAGISGCDVERP